MTETIKIGDLKDPHQVDRLVMAIAQSLCCESGCAVDGIGCKAGNYRDTALRQFRSATINISDDPAEGGA